jgi:arabinose-5-phosphate isomerase
VPVPVEKWALEVLQAEAEAITAVAASLPPALGPAIRAVAETMQPVVCCGVGKSGIVAAKVAATLSSLGIPALALPAGDAAHGDLGAVTPGSVVLLFSNSGSTAEILRILPALRALGCHLVGLIGQAESPLAKAVDSLIPLPIAREADHIGMAPTASTTLQMAMGDAIAVAASRLKGFTPEDFLRRHPAGQLGQLAQPVTAIMRSGDALPTVLPHMAFAETVSVISSRLMGAACVIDWEGRLLGLIVDGDIRRLIQKRGDFYETPASRIMRTDPKVIHSGASVGDALAMVTGLSISVLPVVEADGRLAGMIHMYDLMQVGR